MPDRFANRRLIESLDPERDHQRIMRLSSGYEFPWDYVRSLEFALFKTYCVPSISRLLAETGEFEHRPQKRYDDTALLMAELVDHGYDSPRGKEALRVVNRLHGRYDIDNDDMKYVLSTFVYEPIDWLDRFGWRPLTEQERLGAYHFYRAVGDRMAIRGVPDTYEGFRAFKREYEESRFGYSDTNRRIGQYTLDLFCSWYPLPRSWTSAAVRAMLDDRMIESFGFTPAPALVTRLAAVALRLRARAVRHLPPRRTPRLTNDPDNRTYPGYPTGYRPSDLGAP
ncbi:oxygenase MpaB family protein [Saccharothrix mutabilis subsp. mutabilis]|uniref:Oxygenase MpaB family protein n=1 Tax=Saccharothrix mutabilis subsp. mutabilis TaxID=66855 RepID=A0ABN0UQV8_9PSEU